MTDGNTIKSSENGSLVHEVRTTTEKIGKKNTIPVKGIRRS
jgi:hypothetical protein